MTNLVEIARQALQSGQQKFELADGSLHEAVREISSALSKATDDKVAVQLDTVAEDRMGICYRLLLTTGKESTPLDRYYFVPWSGFSIGHGNEQARAMQKVTKFENVEKVKTHFNGLIENSDSDLMHIALYAMRSSRQ